MTECLVTLATLTLGGGAAILLLLLVERLTGRRYSARWRCWAWLLLAVRLALPVSPSALPHTPFPAVLSPPVHICASDTAHMFMLLNLLRVF